MKKFGLVCDRPHTLKFDSENRLHAEGEPAIQFADGYSLYSHHGVTLLEKYGAVHPHQWQSEWLLTESNSELKRVLIEGIGYTRMCQELQAIEVDIWQEYSLLKIDADTDVEPIYLLKNDLSEYGAHSCVACTTDNEYRQRSDSVDQLGH